VYCIAIYTSVDINLIPIINLPAITFIQIPGEMVNQVRYLYESETATKKAKNIKDVKKMLNRRTKSHPNITKEVLISPSNKDPYDLLNYRIMMHLPILFECEHHCSCEFQWQLD